MKKTFNYFIALTLLAGIVTFTSCDDAVEDIFTPTDSTEVDVEVSATGTTQNSATLFSNDIEGKSEVKALVSLDNALDGDKMDRLYATVSVDGGATEPFDFFALLDAADKQTIKNASKPDGSLDLEGGSRDSLSLAFDLPVPTDFTGEAVYTFWATTGRGDFRDPTKRQATLPVTITLRKGNNPDADLLFDDLTKTLEAPLADRTSETFVSTVDCSIQTLADEEFTAFWDFGFYFLQSTGISLASTAQYPALFDDDGDGVGGTPLVAIAGLTGIMQSDLNECFFEATTITTAEFDAFATSSDLDALTVSSANAQIINNIEAGDVIAFMNQYGKKGVISVTNTVESTGTNGAISFNIKIQP